MQQTGTGTGNWINVSPKNSIKSCQKYMKVVEYWHGTIKNYRYDGDISSSSCVEGGRVGDDGGELVGDDDDGHGSVPAPSEERGRGAPFFLFFLDLLPRWEKDFPSGPWPPWHGRGESPSEIGSVSLSLSVSAFCLAALSPFHIYMEIRNSNWTEIFAVIFS